MPVHAKAVLPVPTEIDPLLRIDEVMTITSFSKATIYRKVADKTFPAPKKISKSRIGFSKAEVAAWRAAQQSTR
jgi:prophage regulatory protein